MPTLTSNNKFNSYYYEIKLNLVTTKDNTTYEYTPFLNKIRVFNDYENNVFPIMTIMLSLTKEMYERIRDNECCFVISSTTKVINTENDTASNLYSETKWLDNEIFYIMDKNKVNFTDNDLNTDNPTVSLQLNLFSKKHLEINKILINDNFINCRLIDIIGFIFKSVSIPMVIEKIENVKKYNQIIIPPLNLIRSIRYLHDYYVLYDDDMKLFFNYNDGILMNNTLSSKTPKLKNEYDTIFFDIVSDNTINASNPYDCAYINKDDGYYYVKVKDTSVRIMSDKRTREEISGTENIVLSRDENLNLNRNDVNSTDDYDITKKQMYYDNIEHPFLDDYYSSNSLKHKMIVTFNNLDIEIFKMNRKFIVPFLDNTYEMKMSRMMFTFLKNSDGFFSSTGSCLLKD